MRDCQLCHSAGGEVIWEDDQCRVVRVGGDEGSVFPGYCRVVWRVHVAEMSDLATAERLHLMNVVVAVESAVRQLVAPDKINLAALGNMVPHLHWHVIPRWCDDSHFPAAIWAAPVRPVAPRPAPATEGLRLAVAAAIEAQEVMQ
jgi:diadenosine tetraphosphate (Ap4A) HIT family hydrolase